MANLRRKNLKNDSDNKLSEKSLHKEMERLRKEASQNNVYIDEDDENANDLSGLSMKDRLAMLKNSSNNKDEKVEIDVSNKEDEVLMETPLPTTLAIDMIPIKKIVKGTVYTEDNRYVKIIEIMPLNFLLKSDVDQESIIDDFEQFLRIAPENMQFKCISKRTDLTRYIEQIDRDIAAESSERCKMLLQDGKELLQELGSTQSVSRRFFLIFDMKKPAGSMLTEDEIEYALNGMKGTAINYLRKCGNTIIEMRNNTDETVRILFDYFNRTKNSTADFAERVREVKMYYSSNYGAKAMDMIPITEYFTPKTLNMLHHEYIKMDDTYYTYLYVTSEGYPSEVFKGWLALIINAGEGVDLNVYTMKQNREKMLANIGRRIRWNTAKIKNLNASTTDFDDVSDATQAGYYLKNGLSANRNDVYYVGLLITITANSLEKMKATANEIKKYLSSVDIQTQDCDYEMKNAMVSDMPLGRMNNKLFRRSKRNILTSDLAAFYPFLSYEMFDENGIFLGMNEDNYSPCITDIFNTRTYKNANIALLGTTGAGKSYTLQLIATRMRKKGIQTFILAPDKGYEFKRSCDFIDGQYIQISPGGSHFINILDIRKKDDAATKALDGDDVVLSELVMKLQTVHIFFKLLIPTISVEEEQFLDEALMTAYAKKGITHDNESLIDPENPDQYKEMPILSDVYEELQTMPAANHLVMLMKRYVDGSATLFNGHTNVNLDNLLCVLDLTNLSQDADLMAAGMFLALDFVYSKAKENRTKKKCIIIDETWELISKNVKAAEYVLEIFKIIRGYGGSAICATQNLADFYALEDGKYGRGIINNCKTKIILNLEKEEADSVRDVLGLSEAEYKKVLKFDKGHALLSSNGNNIPVHFRSSWLENALITTDRGELEALYESGFFQKMNLEVDKRLWN